MVGFDPKFSGDGEYFLILLVCIDNWQPSEVVGTLKTHLNFLYSEVVWH